MLLDEKSQLYILWTNSNPITAEKMVFMYAVNAMKNNWWEAVTVIIWGATAKLVAENSEIQDKIREAQSNGVHLTACKACADQLNVTETLKRLNIEVKYWGTALTDILKNDEKLLTI